MVSRSRSSTNKTPFGFSREELGGLSALEEFDEAEKVGAFDRRVHIQTAIMGKAQ